MIYCYGDSLTEGMPGATYIKFLPKEYKYKNCGVGGDTLLQMTKRLKKKIKKIDKIIICIGINDILLPFFEDYSLSWNIAVKIKTKKKNIISRSLNEFESNYEDLISLIKNKKVIIIGVPLLESNLEVLNDKIIKYNKIIEKLCNKYNILYIDITDEERKYKKNLNYKIDDNWFNVLNDSVMTRKDENIDKLSKERNLFLTVDGIHFNNASACLLARLVTKKLEKFND